MLLVAGALLATGCGNRHTYPSRFLEAYASPPLRARAPLAREVRFIYRTTSPNGTILSCDDATLATVQRGDTWTFPTATADVSPPADSQSPPTDIGAAFVRDTQDFVYGPDAIARYQRSGGMDGAPFALAATASLMSGVAAAGRALHLNEGLGYIEHATGASGIVADTAPEGSVLYVVMGQSLRIDPDYYEVLYAVDVILVANGAAVHAQRSTRRETLRTDARPVPPGYTVQTENESSARPELPYLTPISVLLERAFADLITDAERDVAPTP